jgi:NDP-sugar pyrophosphorylase family protein
MHIVITMAGAGTRFEKAGIKVPKPLIEVLGKTLIEYSVGSFDVPHKFIFVTRDFKDPEDNKKLSELLKKLKPESVEVRLKSLTSGAAESALFAAEYIDSEEPLIIYNCDQFICWNPKDFLQFIEENNPDAALVLYNSADKKNSFAEIIEGKITRVVEKQRISNHALVGLHYWAHGKYFVESARELLRHFRSNGAPECYISETFNYLTCKKILPYHITDNIYVPLGTPEDVARYVGKAKEYRSDKPKTLFVDLDGTILKHHHTISDVYAKPPEVLPGVLEKFNTWDSSGHRIILVTARKESTRKITAQQLQQLGIAYDQLVMGVGSGQRVLINDKLSDLDPDRAIGINIVTDKGLASVRWDDYNL